jgi:hypothetical protein
MGADSVPAEIPQDPTQPKPTDTQLAPNHPAARKEPVDNFADRFVGLSKVHGWMPPQTAATLAMTGGTDRALGGMAAVLRKAYGSVDGSIHYLTEDPLLQKDPSLGLAVRSYLTNTIGPWPLQDGDLVHVQKQLAAKGYGQGLPTNGVWNNGWNGAYSQYVQAAKTAELGGSQAGSTPLGRALGVFNSLLPRQAATAVAGFVASVPHSAAGDLRNVAGGFAGGFQLLTHPQETVKSSADIHRAMAGYAAPAENVVQGAIGQPKNITPATSYEEQGFRGQETDALQILGDVLATHGLFKAGGAVAAAAGDNAAEGLDAAAARRGPGVIAKTLYKAPTQAEGGATGVLSSKAVANTPILKMTGPLVDKILGEEGSYYRARTLLARPYAYAPVRTAGTAIGQLGVAGAKIRGIGTAQSIVQGSPSELSQSIDHMQRINQLDDMLQAKLGFTVLGHHISPGLNTLAWVLHPPLTGPGTISASVGSDVTGANDAMQEAMGSSGLGTAIVRGVNAGRNSRSIRQLASGQGEAPLSHADLVEAAGGDSNFIRFWTNKVYQHAAAHYAEVEWAKMPKDEQATQLQEFGDQYSVLNNLATEAYQKALNGDHSDLQRSAAEMISHDKSIPHWGGNNELSNRIASEIQKTSASPRSWIKDNTENFHEMSQIMREIVVPRRAEMIHDEVPGGTIGVARKADYKPSGVASAEATDMEDRYNDALSRLQAGGEGSDDAAKDVQRITSEIAGYLFENYGIDADHMPANVTSDNPSDMTLIKLLHQKAENQASEIYLREHPVRTKPDDLPVTLNRSGPTDTASLDQHTPGALYLNTSPRQAMEVLHESQPEVRQWANDRNQLQSNKGITFEHDPTGLTGQRDLNAPGARYQELRNRSKFQAGRTDTGLNGVRSVEIRPLRGESQAETAARRLLTGQLQDNGYIPFDQGAGIVRWVRNDLTGGTLPVSPQLREAFARLDELGYMPVMGKGIGFDFYNHPALDVFDSHLSAGRRLVERLGMSPENISSSNMGLDFNIRLHNELQNQIEKGKSEPTGGIRQLPPYFNAHTIIAELRDKNLIKSNPGIASFIQRHVPPTSAYKASEDKLTELFFRKGDASGNPITEPAARQLAAQELSNEVENSLGLMHVTEKDLKSVLGRRANEDVPKETQLARELEYRHYNPDQVSGGLQPLSRIYKERPLMTDDDIHEVYRAIQKAKADMPTRLLGLQKVENLAAQKLSYMGRPVPGSAGRMLENLPTRLATLRNKFRFQLSPEFSVRRVVKAMVKVSADGVPPTFFPKIAMDKMGVYKEAHRILDKAMPELKNDSYDEGTQALYAVDPWGMFNHRDHEAYAAYHWKQAGLTNTEIKANLVKDFGYGSAAYGEGRSALERSVNFVFFPFSFDKTLYRNMGAYMLDHTAQRMMLTAGLQAYNEYNMADPTGSKLLSSGWVQKHMPVAQEALRLNAFAHGVGLGQFGGINAPILNLFLPQQYNADAGGVQTIKGFVPAARELQDVVQEITQQAAIVKQVSLDQLHPAKSGIFFARPVAETPDSQLSDAYAYRRQLNAAVAKYVEYNAHHTSKYKLGNNPDEYGQWAGSTINATLIDQLVHQKYPAFQIEDPSVYYAKAAAQITDYSQQMKEQGHEKVVEWIEASQKVGQDIYRGKFNNSQASTNTRILRTYAVDFAETIPGFLTFYNQNFRWQYGPLEAVR